MLPPPPPPLLQLLFSDPGDSAMKRESKTLAAFSAVRRFSFALSISARTSSSSCPLCPVKTGQEAAVEAGMVVEVVVVAKISAEVVVVVVVEVASRCSSVEVLFVLLFEDDITADVLEGSPVGELSLLLLLFPELLQEEVIGVAELGVMLMGWC